EKCAARGLRERRFRFLETTLTSCTQPCKKLRIPKQVRFRWQSVKILYCNHFEKRHVPPSRVQDARFVSKRRTTNLAKAARGAFFANTAKHAS
ncbi:MAG: hypothetical protein H7834_14190, partial [Magnetococcus sp. YQC-9]